MKRTNDPLEGIPDLGALFSDRKRLVNRLIWSVVLAPPLSMSARGREVAGQQPAPAAETKESQRSE